MISWIQKYFQKHFWLVFLAVLVAVGLPMIVVYSASGSGNGRDGIKVLERPFFDVNLANPEQARRIFADGELSSYLRAGYGALQGGQLQQYALQRVAGKALAEELHLPSATPAEVARYVPTLRAFQNQQGQFDQSIYTRFADSLKGGPFSIADVNRVLRDDARLENLSKVLGGPGYVLPSDVKQQLSRIDSVWTVQVASLDYASFSPAMSPTEEALKKFYEEHSGNYDVPARPRLSMVEFKTAEFTPPNGPTDSEMRAFYNTNLASFPVPPDADKKDAPALATPAAPVDNFPKVRAQVEAVMRDAASRKLAAQAANELTVALYERKLAANSPELAAFLASQHRTAAPVPAFAPDNPPADKPWLGNHAEAISRLTQQRYFSDPLTAPDGAVVLLWQESLPAYKPLFAEVREHVAADYRENEKRRLFIERGIALKAQLQAAAKTPAGFAEKAASEKLEVKSYANFTMRQPPKDLPQPALATLVRLEAGHVSDMIGLADKGILVYAQEKKLPDLSPTNPRFAEIQGQLMTFIASNNENSVLGDLVDQELKKTSKTETP